MALKNPTLPRAHDASPTRRWFALIGLLCALGLNPAVSRAADPITPTERAALVELMADMQETIRVQHRQSLQAMAELKLDELIEPAFIVDPKLRADGERRLAAFEILLQKQLAFSDELKHRLVDRAERTLSPAQRAPLYEGVEESKTVTDRLMQDAAQAHRAYMAGIRELFRFAAARQGRLVVEGDQFVFSNQKEMDTYNALVGRLNNAVARTQAVAAQAAERQRQGNRKLEALGQRLGRQ